MERAQFDAMVQRLESDSARAPRLYLAKVTLLTLLGFALLALIVGIAASGLAVLVGIALALMLKGGALWLWLIKFSKLGWVLAVPLWLLVKASVQALFVRIPAPQGREITRREAPALFAALDDMRRRLRGPKFHHVLVDDQMNAAVSQRPAFGLFGWPRNYLILGLPLLEGLQPEEALAVVAHEYGHVAGAHGRFGAYIYRLRHTWGTIQDTALAWHGWAGRLLGRMVAWYAPYFNAYTFVLARANEYQADATAADLVGAHAAARALKRFHVTNGQHGHFISNTFDAMRDQASPPRDLAHRWAAHAVQTPAREQALGWLQNALDRAPKALDTHPTLRQRLRALLPNDETGAVAPPDALNGASAAQTWFGQLADRLRDEQQHQWLERVEEPWREQHEQWQRRRERLSELTALAAPDAEQQLELLQLRIDLEPQHDHVAALAAYNAAHPDHALALFLEGGQRLDRDDEQGLAVLERAMALDADAIKPGCERAFRYLTDRNDSRADDYQKRWHARERWEQERQLQIDTLRGDDTLMAADLDAAAMALLRERLLAHGSQVAQAWIARRVIAADPAVRCFVLGIDATTWARWRRKDKALLHALAALEWPFALHVCLLNGQYKALRKQFEQLADAQLT